MAERKPAADDKQRLYELVHDVLMVGIQATGGTIPEGQGMRRVVRACAEAISEINAPTQAPVPKKKAQSDPEEDGAELVVEDELAQV